MGDAFAKCDGMGNICFWSSIAACSKCTFDLMAT